MLLGGLQKTTLVDFPGKIACTVFTVGCNFRCPFCHNRDLITVKLFKKSGIAPIDENYFFTFLKKRRKILDGVCITGGEPTLQPDLLPFCRKIKKLGLKTKLDSNGSNPQVLKKAIQEKVIDFIAMDVKTAFGEYEKAIGIKFPEEKVKQSIKIILSSGLDYELRTTLVPGIHNQKTIIEMAQQLKRIGKKYGQSPKSLVWIFQNFRPQGCLDKKMEKVKPFTSRQLAKFLGAAQKILPQTRLRDKM